KLKSSLARRIIQSLDYSMITSAAAVKHNLLDPFAHCRLRCQRPHTLCTGCVRCKFFAVRHRFARRRGKSQCCAGEVIDKLNVNVLVRKADAHARTFLCALDFFADTPVATLREAVFLFGSHRDKFLFLVLTPYWTVLPSLRTTRSSV